MSGIRFFRLVDRFVVTLEQLGATVIRESSRDDERPARFRVITNDGSTDCLLFLWTITPGGGKSDSRPKNERRIQMTKVEGGIPLLPGFQTLLGGWSEEFGVFCFWDVSRHTRFSPNSPSLQVTSGTLEAAHHVGIATYIRPALEGDEVVVAVAPDSLLWYVQHGQQIHHAGKDADSFAELSSAKPEDVNVFLDESQSEGQAARRVTLVNLMRAFRDSKFQPAVLRAYRSKCAVCECALKLVDAAHIVPVSHPKSTDDVTNGIALCRLHHGAYDNGLLGIQSDYRIVTNPEAEKRLRQLYLDAGLPEFQKCLPERISLPNNLETRPDPVKLKIGLEVRRWPASFVV